MTARVRAIALPKTPLPPTREYRYIPPLPAGMQPSMSHRVVSKTRADRARQKSADVVRKIEAEDIQEGIRLREAGYTWKATGEALHVTGNAIRLAIKRHGEEV